MKYLSLDLLPSEILDVVLAKLDPIACVRLGVTSKSIYKILRPDFARQRFRFIQTCVPRLTFSCGPEKFDRAFTEVHDVITDYESGWQEFPFTLKAHFVVDQAIQTVGDLTCDELRKSLDLNHLSIAKYIDSLQQYAQHKHVPVAERSRHILIITGLIPFGDLFCSPQACVQRGVYFLNKLGEAVSQVFLEAMSAHPNYVGDVSKSDVHYHGDSFRIRSRLRFDEESFSFLKPGESSELGELPDEGFCDFMQQCMFDYKYKLR